VFPATLPSFALFLLLAGACAGLIAGLFGVGGGIVIVPVLFMIFKAMHVPSGIAIHMAVGTSLAVIIPTSIASLSTHHRHGAVDRTILKQWSPAVIIGALLGGYIANLLSGPALSLIFGIFTVFIAALMGLAPPHLRLARHPPKGWKQTPLAGAIGFISALVGVGGGSMTVPTLVLCNVSIHRAVGTASAIGFLISLPATIIFLFSPTLAGTLPPGSFGHVNLIAFALLAPVTMLTAPFGARLAHKLHAKNLRRYFAIFLVLIAIKMIAGALR
jgi:uncharacterized protein